MPMFMLVDNVLSQVIENQLSNLRQNPSLLDTIFQAVDDNTRNQVKGYILNNQLNVFRGFPRDPAALPAYAIVLGSEREEPQAVGQYLYDDTANTQEVYGTFYVAQYRLEAWSNNGDLTILLYNLLKWILLSNRDYLESQGIQRQNLTGTDFEPVPSQFPELIYRRALLMELTYEVRWLNPYTNITNFTLNETLTS